MPDYKAQVAGLYPLGAGIDSVLQNGFGISSSILNTRDLGQPGAPDFLLLGPGSQVWFLCYSFKFLAQAVPANPLGLTLQLEVSYQSVAPFFFASFQQITLPVYTQNLEYVYSGHVRLEAPAAQWQLSNLSGQDLTVSFQFWGKGI